jgi:H/ACA ribonucleoprotein complex non-core subunit NAF1
MNEKFMRMMEADSSECSSSSSSDSSDEEDLVHKKVKVVKKKLPATKKEAKEVEEEDEEDDDDEGGSNRKQLERQKYLKTKDELTLDDLAPIEQLNLSVEGDIKLIKMGRVISIVDDKLVIIQSVTCDETRQVPALDEETILFDSKRKALGKIFEIFGPVSSPFYSIRFNSAKDIKDNDLDLNVNSFVFFAPESTKYTKFIFNVDELRQLKGSDASWNHDNEPPAEYLDYSDDEQEKIAKRQLKSNKRSAGKAKSAEDLDSSSVEETEEGWLNKIRLTI